jgi:HemY protein
MKKLILFFIVLFLAVGLGVVIQRYPATLLLSIGSIQIQASLWFALTAVIVGIFLLRQILRCIQGIYHIPAHVHHFLADRRTQKLQVFTQKARRALLEENWLTCETYFYKSAKKTPSPFFYYLAAAHAAGEQKKYTSAEKYLEKAQKIAQTPDDLFTLRTMHARTLLDTKDYHAAHTILTTLEKTAPTHPFVLNGLKEVCLASQDWQKLHALLPLLRKHHILLPTELDTFEHTLYSALLHQAGKTKILPLLKKTWKTFPKTEQENPHLIAIYVHYLLTYNQQKTAEKILKTALSKKPEACLLQQYTQLQSEDSVKQLAHAELWLKKDPQNADILFCVGSLCARYRIWGKAKTYLEKSLSYAPRAETYMLLGKVLEELDQKYAALDCYKTGLHSLGS